MIELNEVTQRYRSRSRSGETLALDGVSLSVADGEFVCLRGASGSGKTTLLLTAGAMLAPTAGSVRVAGHDLRSLGSRERARFRREHVGFVFQMFHLVPYLDVTGNVTLARTDGRDPSGLLTEVGLAQRATHKPPELSAGERQRVAIARALHAEPSVVLADEPTGNLDPENGRNVLDLLSAYHGKGGTVLLVTHGREAAERADRVVWLDNGRVAPAPGS